MVSLEVYIINLPLLLKQNLLEYCQAKNNIGVTADEIIKAIRGLYNGGSPMSPFIARKVIGSFQKPAITDEHSLLSLREKEVLELLAKGLLYKEIAEQLNVTHETIKKHLKNIYQKLHVQNKIEALNKFKLL